VISILKGRKVVIVFASLDLGGSERRGLLLADYLHRRLGASVQIMGLGNKRGRVCEVCEELGLPWSGMPFHWGLRRRLPSLLRAVRALREAGPEIILSYTRVPNLVCAWGSRWIGAKLLVWNQGDEGLLLDGSFPYRVAARVPHCFISNSTGGKEFLLKTYGIPPQDVHLVANGIALQAPKAGKEHWRRQWGAIPGTLVVGMVANLSIYKDHETLLRAWSRVITKEWQNPPLLVLAGRCDGTESGLTRLARELGIGEHVRFLGPIDDVAGMLGAIDLFAYSSKCEGVPNGVLEAMASGLAIVGTDIPGIREAVGPDDSRYLCAVGDSAGMAELINELLRDETLRYEVGRALQQRIEREFTLETMCRKSAEIISKALVACERTA